MKQKATVRCYCHGFGDCFLIKLETQSGTKKIVIDCGVLKNSEREVDRILAVAQSLSKDTEGEIDVLVMTHEHWDHLCGFKHADFVWRDIKVKEVWMAWTEKPGDPQAARLQKQRSDAEQALRIAFARMSPLSDNRSRVSALLGFSDDVRSARDFVQSLAIDGNIKYWEPGDQTVLDGVEVFFLGPPRDEKLLKRTEGDMKKALAALSHGMGTPPPPDDYESHMRFMLGLAPIPSPFEKRFQVPPVKAGSSPYYSSTNQWRRLGAELLDGSADQLALQLDSYTNNTSLVIAFRLNGRDVLLFPGDAQGGNWQSWEQSEKEPGLVQTLLAQTCFYKVGHHGSHNGTFIKARYELIPKEAFVFMPFEKVKKWPSIPFQGLVNMFGEHKTFVRADQSHLAAPPVVKAPATETVPGDNRPLWVEVSF